MTTTEDPICGDCEKHVPITSMWQNFRNTSLTCNSCIEERVKVENKEVWDALHELHKYLAINAKLTEPPHFSQVYLDINKILGRYNW